MSIVSEIERKVCAMPKQFRDWFAEFYHATCSGEGRQMTDEEVETSVSTWQAATAAADAEWRGVVEKATALCDQMARDGYQNAKLEAVRELREALVQAEKLMGRKQMTQKPDNPQAFPCQGTADGMTLRDYFAAAALPSIILSLPITGDGDTQAASVAYTYADAMLKAREA